MPSRVRFWRAKNVFEAFPTLQSFVANAGARGAGGAVAVRSPRRAFPQTRRRGRLRGASAAAARSGVVGMQMRRGHARRDGRRHSVRRSGGVGARARRRHAPRGPTRSATPATRGAPQPSSRSPPAAPAAASRRPTGRRRPRPQKPARRRCRRRLCWRSPSSRRRSFLIGSKPASKRESASPRAATPMSTRRSGRWRRRSSHKGARGSTLCNA